jgi:hypothetical protein
VFAGTAATVIAILYGVHRSLVQANWPASARATFRARRHSPRLARTTALQRAWRLPCRFRSPNIRHPAAICVLLIWRSKHSAIAAVPQHWLVGVQLYRALA